MKEDFRNVMLVYFTASIFIISIIPLNVSGAIADVTVIAFSCVLQWFYNKHLKK